MHHGRSYCQETADTIALPKWSKLVLFPRRFPWWHPLHKSGIQSPPKLFHFSIKLNTGYRRQSMYINPMYKGLQHRYYRVCGSVTRDKAYELINKFVKYEHDTLSTKVISVFKTVERHQCCIWWGRTPCQTWKDSRSGKMVNAALNNIYWAPWGRDWLCTLSMTVDSTSQTHSGRQHEQQDQNFNWELLWAKRKFCVHETD